MKHYLCLLQDSKIHPGAWIGKHFYKTDPKENFIPVTTGLFSEFQRDNLDLDRALDWLEEAKWSKVGEVERLKDFPDGARTAPNGRISWTIDEFLNFEGGAITGIFFDIDGSFVRVQRYALDLTTPK